MNSRMIVPARPKGLRFEVPTIAEGAFDVQARSDDATITIFDVIGLDVTASRIAAALRSIGDKPVTLLINSPGGDYFEGAAIYNLLRAHSKPVTAQIVGVAASAASLLAMGASRVEVARNASMMIHNCWILMAGDANELEAAAEWVRQFDEAAAQVYADRSGLPPAAIRKMMDAETWFDSGQALAQGFADALLDRDADPALRALEANAPQSKRDLETQLRKLGFAKAAAERLAAGGWAALKRDDDGPALQQLAEVLQAQAGELARLGSKGAR